MTINRAYQQQKWFPSTLILLKLFGMNVRTELSCCSTPRRFYIKRHQMKEIEPVDSSSMFIPTLNKDFENFSLIDDIKKFQTITTTIDNTVTLTSNPQQATIQTEKLEKRNKSDFLPPLNLTLQSKLSHDTKSIQLLHKKKTLSSTHASDPQYIIQQKTMPKRVQQKYSKYKKGWADYCRRRKEKSVIERSLQKAANSIELINLDADRRQNTTELSEMLRNNIAQKTFVFPGKIRSDIAGIKGKGGKVVPLFSEVYVVEEVYKHHKRKQQEKR